MLLPGCRRTCICAGIRRHCPHGDPDGHIHLNTREHVNACTESDADKHRVCDTEFQSHSVAVAYGICSTNADLDGIAYVDRNRSSLGDPYSASIRYPHPGTDCNGYPGGNPDCISLPMSKPRAILQGAVGAPACTCV